MTELPTYATELALVTTAPGSEYLVRGIYLRGGEVHVHRGGHLGFTRLHAAVVGYRPLTAAEYLARIPVGARVLVPKYGRTYPARVVAHGRTRVTVEFTTAGGATKRATLPLGEVGLPT